MMLFRRLWQESSSGFGAAIASSVACAILMMGLVRVLSQYISGSRGVPPALWVYVMLAGGTVVCQLLALVLISRITSRTVMQLRRGVVVVISAAPLAILEKVGPSRLLAALSDDPGRVESRRPEQRSPSHATLYSLPPVWFTWHRSRLRSSRFWRSP